MGAYEKLYSQKNLETASDKGKIKEAYVIRRPELVSSTWFFYSTDDDSNLMLIYYSFFNVDINFT